MTTPSENYESHDDNPGGYGSPYGGQPSGADPYASGEQPYGTQSPYGSPQYGAQSYEAQAYGAPQYGAQPFESQTFGSQPYGAQSYEAQQYGAQPFGAPQYGAPQYGAQPYGTPGAMQPYGPANGTARKEPALSLVLSFFLPGLGTLINGQAGKGIGIMAGYFLGVLLSIVLIGIPIMLGFWVWGMVDAYSGAKNHNLRHGFH